jgi:GTP-binding protein EngB required for normal cell division
VLPKLFSKFATLGAAAGGATIAGLVYIQNQATAAGTYISDLFVRTKDGAEGVAGEVYGGATDAMNRIMRGWAVTKEKIETPAWMGDIFGGKSDGSEESSGNGQTGGGGEPPKKSSAGAAGAAVGAAAAIGYGDEERIAGDDQMMLLTKKMIQIRSLLQSVGQSESLTLPSIVVIGSQSSGKSSVLEAIVGHEFLPKGNNMVTRRPIELTLVNTPDAHAEYAEFPALGLGKVTDFTHVQKTLTDLNLAVSPQECVSDDPIQLSIYSPNVPDLSLIDLPGYIQVVGNDQPAELKEKIAALCEKYIQAPNIILAISAADVDLANSTSLRASRRVDPRGERTIGVITKMDLVEAERGLGLLTDRKYPLRLGYVGVVCKLPSSPTGMLFHRGSNNISGAIIRNEKAYFSAHAEFSPNSPVSVGTPNLKQKLMHVLEQTMAASLKSTSEAIKQELAEATYEFKVQYNDRPLSAETYLAESLDSFKHAFRGFTESFGRDQVRELLKRELDQQVLNILAQKYWNKPIHDLIPPAPETDPLSDLPKSDPEHPLWHLKLDSSTSSLTKLGIGRLATTVVASALHNHIDSLIAGSTFAAHPSARQAITEAATSILRDLSYDISDELEICIKPYKYRIELGDLEWSRGRESISKVLRDELRDCEAAVKAVENQVGGRRKLRDVMGFIDRVRGEQVVLEGDGSGGAGGFSSALLAKGKNPVCSLTLLTYQGREAVFLRDRAALIRMRLAAVKAKQCSSKNNKYYCPEVFLDAVADKLTTTADLFLDAELLSKFYYSVSLTTSPSSTLTALVPERARRSPWTIFVAGRRRTLCSRRPEDQATHRRRPKKRAFGTRAEGDGRPAAIGKPRGGAGTQADCV